MASGHSGGDFPIDTAAICATLADCPRILARRPGQEEIASKLGEIANLISRHVAVHGDIVGDLQ